MEEGQIPRLVVWPLETGLIWEEVKTEEEAAEKEEKMEEGDETLRDTFTAAFVDTFVDNKDQDSLTDVLNKLCGLHL